MDDLTKRFLQYLAFLSTYGRDLIVQFSKRYENISEHNKLVIQILFHFSDKRKESLERQGKPYSIDGETIIRRLEQIKKLLPFFGGFGSIPDQRLDEIFKQDKEILLILKKNNELFAQELRSVLTNLRSLRSKAVSHTIEEQLRVNYRLSEEEQHAFQLTQYVINLISNWHYMVMGLKEEVESEKQVISVIGKELRESNILDLRSRLLPHLQSLHHIAENISLSIKREKEEFIIPISKILADEFDLETVIRSLILRNKKSNITLDDVKQDLRSLSRPEEVSLYIHEMTKFLATLIAKTPPNEDKKGWIRIMRFLSSYGSFSSIGRLRELPGELFEAAQSQIDHLTGGIRGDFFMQQIGPRLLAQRSRRKLAALFFFDIDNFKTFNDLYGHPVGNYVLNFVGKVIRLNIRIGDFFVRYGGEEFIVFTPDTNKNGAKAAAEKIAHKIQEESRSLMESINLKENVQIDKIRREITVSGGVSFYEYTDRKVNAKIFEEKLHELIKVADEAMYTAKRSGKNRVIVVNKEVTV